ncbi:MAG: ribonuclease III [Proteobacteria bacterium]|nr:ribonuclease III [Pseudomonadota bacterium]
MDISEKIDELESKLAYSFNNKDFLKEALTHKSFSNENRSLNLKDNERLEFLGDAVLDLVISELLFKMHTGVNEGELSKKRSLLVREEPLFQIAMEIGLGEYLLLGKGEEQTGGRLKSSLLANAFEALIASIYLDGGLEKVKDFIKVYFVSRLTSQTTIIDFKSEIQERIQKDKKGNLKYSVIADDGPDHDKTFQVALDLKGEVIAQGEGKNIKEAEQMAAKMALQKLYALE